MPHVSHLINHIGTTKKIIFYGNSKMVIKGPHIITI